MIVKIHCQILKVDFEAGYALSIKCCNVQKCATVWMCLTTPTAPLRAFAVEAFEWFWLYVCA